MAQISRRKSWPWFASPKQYTYTANRCQIHPWKDFIPLLTFLMIATPTIILGLRIYSVREPLSYRKWPTSTQSIIGISKSTETQSRPTQRHSLRWKIAMNHSRMKHHLPRRKKLLPRKTLLLEPHTTPRTRMPKDLLWRVSQGVKNTSRALPHPRVWNHIGASEG